ncbi:MAG TPA: tRNA lysidine(34) synthetase TilS [Blattabacteriaceae bacterium]
MLNEEKLFREIKKILPLDKKILVAVSGGIDSMTLLNILLKLRRPLGVVHANFQLRGDFSNKDETFVTDVCKKKNIPLYKKRFNVIANKNMQITARELRYDWFEQLLKTKSYDFLALGHHLDDSIENFFLNLIRGTGIKGFLGIPKKIKQYIRPLLTLTKAEIISYANKYDISWREDTSNSKNEYFRNSVRNCLVPVLKKLSINFSKNFQKTINYLYDTSHLENEYLQKISEEITEEKTFHPYFWKINCKKLKKIQTLTTCLFKLFSPYGFVNITDMIRLLNAQSGKQIFSRKYRILKDRNYWILVPRIINIEQKVYKIIDLLPKKTPFSLYFSFNNKIEASADAAVDLYKLHWPLQLRTWKKGDYFYPLNFKKKLSKYFKDEKLSLFEKDHIWILTNAYNDIVWIVKRRLDDRFKVTEKTKHVLNIHLS